MSYREEALVFECQGDRLLGIVALPGQEIADTGVVVVVGGPQYRAGSHRLFTLLARHLAANKVPSLRFDYRGMGDSEGDPRGFEVLNDDLDAAMNAFRDACPRVRRIVIWGLCDAASAALLYCAQGPHVAGLVLANPWVHTERRAAQARLHHYYLGRLLQRSLWEKLLSREIPIMKTLGDLLGSFRKALGGPRRTRGNHAATPEGTDDARTDDGVFVDNMLAGLANFDGPVLFILSGNDLTAAEFSSLVSRDRGWKKACKRENVRFLRLAEATHTFSSAVWRNEVAEATLSFVEHMNIGSVDAHAKPR